MRTALKMLFLRRRRLLCECEESRLVTETKESSEMKSVGESDATSVCTFIDHGPEPKTHTFKYNVKCLGRKFVEGVKNLFPTQSRRSENVKESPEVRRERTVIFILKFGYAVCLAIGIVILASLAIVVVLGLAGAILV